MANLFGDDSQQEQDSVPSYLLSADNHNIANNNYSWTDAVTKGTVGVVASAAAQVADILPTIGNWLGGDFEHIRTQDILQSFDDDYSKYYVDHAEGIDALGFALGSIVPGSAGIKVAKAGGTMLRNAAATGKFGANIERATGVLAPSQPKLLSQAVQKALQPNAGFPVFNSETAKLVATGYAQAALEGAAFETAVAATMSNSPILKDQDFGDIVSNIMHGALVFGAIGGTISGASSFYKIKNAGKELDKIAMENRWNLVPELGNKASPSDRIISYLDDLHTTPKGFGAYDAAGENWKGAKFQSLYEDKVRHVQTRVRELTGELAKGDQELAEVMYQKYISATPEVVSSKAWKTEEIARLNTPTQYEKSLVKLQKTAVELGDDAIKEVPNKSLVYVRIAGEGAAEGVTVAEAPLRLHIADSLKSGEDYFAAIRGAGQTLAKKFSPFEATPEIAEARYVTAAKHTFKTDGSEVIAWNDLPYLQAAYVKAVPEVAVKRADGSITTFTDSKDLFEYIKVTKEQIAEELVATGKSVEVAAKLTDMSVSHTSGKTIGEIVDNVILTKTGTEFSTPQWAKVVKDLTEVKALDGTVLEGMVAIKQQQALYEEAAERVAAMAIGEDAQRFIKITDKDVLGANRAGVGGGMFSAQNENFGTLASKMQYNGSQTLRVADKMHTATRTEMEPLLYKLGQKPEAAIEWSVLNSTIRQYPEAFGYDAATQSLKPMKIIKYEKALAEGADDLVEPILAEGIPLAIPIKNAEVVDLVAMHISKNGDRSAKLGAIRANQGMKWTRDPEAFYPIPANPKDYPHFAFVVDDSLTGYGRSKMLTAASPEELERMITEVKSADSALKVLTKKDAENWYEAVGKYDYERTLTDVSFDTSISRTGKSAAYLPATDPQKIISDTLNWHLQRDTNLVRETVLHMNEASVSTLRTMGEKYANVNSSHYSKLDPLSYVEMQRDNPYANYVKSMLGLSTAKEFPFWSPMNDMLDRKFSALFSSTREAVRNSKSPEELVAINKMLRDAGYQGADYTAGMVAAANHTAPKGALTAFMAKANSILSAATLGWDPINAVNNVVGATVLRSTELRSLVKAIESGNKDIAGELAQLGKLKLPGTDNLVLSPAKLIGNAMKQFHSDDGKALRELFKERGIISSRVDQMKWVVDNLALTGKESVAELDGIINKTWTATKDLLSKGDKITGNALAEDFNRFVSGHVAKQITDLGVKAGVIGEKEAWAYINTFVNRVEGNYIAAQRPGVFQGPVGQAIGLFQSYQFNLLQQLFRYVGEGTAKDSAMLMGLQGSIYGLKGLPAFDAINTHIIGNASGNQEHRDLYSTVFGAAGKEAGDWLLYGMSSNALGLIHPDLKFNLYSRGDINPRNVTLLPVNPANTPLYQMSAKFFGSLKETYGKINAGGDVWGSVLQGIEHAGVNRPLAGLAQALQAGNNPYARSFSTSNKGNVIASNDFLSLSNLVRVAGAKPLDEAIGIDRAYGIEAYAAYDKERRNTLGEAIKTTVIAGKNPSEEQINTFATKYAATGGRQEHFAQWMMQLYKTANTSQVNQLTNDLRNPLAQGMQKVMGGYNMRDFVYGGGF